MPVAQQVCTARLHITPTPHAMLETLNKLGPTFGWTLAVVAIALGYTSYGWPGVVLAITVTVFWLLLQFSRAVRAMRDAANAPIGNIANAVMLHARLRERQRLVEVIKLTRSLGLKLGNEPETYAWTDDGGDSVRVELVAGRVTRWTLERASASSSSSASEPAPDTT